MIGWMKPGAVIPLMYEAWEFRSDDVDLAACRQWGVLVGGTNERHPMIDVFSFLGIMAIKLLTDAGVGVYASRILLLCDNPFRPFLERDLKSVGASVDVVMKVWSAVTDSETLRRNPDRLTAPFRSCCFGYSCRHGCKTLARNHYRSILGGHRSICFLAAGIPVWPLEAPTRGIWGFSFPK